MGDLTTTNLEHKHRESDKESQDGQHIAVEHGLKGQAQGAEVKYACEHQEHDAELQCCPIVTPPVDHSRRKVEENEEQERQPGCPRSREDYPVSFRSS